jgi:hypothetical protein
MQKVMRRTSKSVPKPLDAGRLPIYLAAIGNNLVTSNFATVNKSVVIGLGKLYGTCIIHDMYRVDDTFLADPRVSVANAAVLNRI